MAELHVLCIDRDHLECIDRKANLYTTAYWPVIEEDAKRLIGGTIYLHEKKRQPAYFGGTVLSYTETDKEPWVGRLVFTFKATAEAKGAKWRGVQSAMAWVGGVVD